ncbi:MAG: hypothetical protein AAGB34_08175 [Planctomycetota bacterium]
MKNVLTIAALTAAAGFASAQAVEVAVTTNDTPAPGGTITVDVTANMTGFSGTPAFAGYGLDLDVTAGTAGAAGFSTATSGASLQIGTLAGTVDGTTGLDRAVGGQVSNIFNVNPSVDTSSSVLLFSADFTIDAGCTEQITIGASVASNGGVVVYPDANAGTNVFAGESGGPTLSFTDLVIDCAAPSCDGDANGDNVVNVDDFIAVLLNFGGAGPVGDANNDSVVNVADFIAVLLNFGQPC